jgi:hypothetical protein
MNMKERALAIWSFNIGLNLEGLIIDAGHAHVSAAVFHGVLLAISIVALAFVIRKPSTSN